jgi:hypothetical protein
VIIKNRKYQEQYPTANVTDSASSLVATFTMFIKTYFASKHFRDCVYLSFEFYECFIALGLPLSFEY